MRGILLLATIFILSCNNEAGNKTPASFNGPQWKSIDSLELLYFKDPDGDSLRYTRFYTYLATKDSSIINGLLNNIDQASDTINEVRPCRSEGKIFAHHGDRPIKTFYFSTRCDSCCYIYYITNGKFVYSRLSEELMEELKKSKPLSSEPVAIKE